MPASRKDVRADVFWDAVKSRLDSTRMREILGESRIYQPGDEIPDREDGEGKPWGRVIVMPSNAIWETQEIPNTARGVGFTLKVEFADFRATGYRVAVALSAAHEEAFSLLDNWSPGTLVDGATRVLVYVPVYRDTPPDHAPLLDDDLGMWVMSATYRAELAAA